MSIGGDELAGRRLASYTLGERIGEGGMGTVYRATHRQTGHVVAIKVLRGGVAAEPEFQARFNRECRTQIGLDHANIVRVLEFGAEHSLSYLVMEFVNGRTLRSLVCAPEQVSLDVAVGIGSSVARALEYMHGRDLLHRDIKPANVFLTTEGIVKLGDLGLVKDLNRTEITVAGNLVGTLCYLAPESLFHARFTRLSDIYQVGLLLYELLTARLPFQDASRGSLAQALLRAPTSPRHYRPDLPESVEDCILACLAPDERRRPTSADVLRAQLESLLHGLAPASHLQTGPPGERPVDVGPTQASSPDDPSPWARAAGPLPEPAVYGDAVAKRMDAKVPMGGSRLRGALAMLVAIVAVVCLGRLVDWRKGGHDGQPTRKDRVTGSISGACNRVPADAKFVYLAATDGESPAMPGAGLFDIWVHDGQKSTQITLEHPRRYEHADVSPDRRLIAANELVPRGDGSGSKRSRIWLIDVTEGMHREIAGTFDSAGMGGVAWDPGGNLYFCAQAKPVQSGERGEPSKIGLETDVYRVLGIDTPRIRMERLTTGTPAEEVGVSVSPDGRYVAFVRPDPGQPHAEIWTMAPDGSDQRLVYREARMRFCGAALSDDNQRLTFCKFNSPDRNGSNEQDAPGPAPDVWAMDLVTREPRRLSKPGPASIHPDWLHDQILYTELGPGYRGASIIDLKDMQAHQVLRGAISARWIRP